MLVFKAKDRGSFGLGAWIRYGLRPYRWGVGLLFLLFAIAGFFKPIVHFLLKDVIDALPLIPKQGLFMVWRPCIFLILLVMFSHIINATKTYLQTRYQALINNHIVEKWLGIVLEQSPEYYKNRLSGKVASDITKLASSIATMSQKWVPKCILIGFQLISSFILSYNADAIFFYILLGWAVVFLAISIPMSKKIATLSGHQALADNTILGQLVDVISNHIPISLFFRKDHERERMGIFFRASEIAYKILGQYQRFMLAIQGVLVTAMIGTALYFLVMLYAENKLTIGDFTLILSVFMGAIQMVTKVTKLINEWDSIFGQCKQSLFALNQACSVRDRDDAKPLSYHTGRIVWHDVDFQYTGMDPLFSQQSLVIPGGQKVGLVGYSGGGKTTFIHLLLRFYDVTHGAITIDDQNIQNVTQESLRQWISLIPQDTALFHRTIMENIRYGRIDATDQEVMHAAKQAYAHDFIETLPQGYDTMVGERGLTLSGGQRQRIAIARAILKKAPILILDEATSQLDSLTENEIQKSLTHVMKEKTTLVVAHRLSTLLQMDRILVFDRGRIIQDGTHQQLLNQDGLYKTMWNAQVAGFIGDERA
jgi:ATP-binding cassette subfamily B protein